MNPIILTIQKKLNIRDIRHCSRDEIMSRVTLIFVLRRVMRKKSIDVDIEIGMNYRRQNEDIRKAESELETNVEYRKQLISLLTYLDSLYPNHGFADFVIPAPSHIKALIQKTTVIRETCDKKRAVLAAFGN